MAFGSFNPQADEDMRDINVTPLVDVMLVLMIVFMLSMPIFTSALRVDLPTSSEKTPLVPKEIVRIAIDGEGHYFVDDTPIAEGELRAALHRLKGDRDEVILAIHADKAAAYGAMAALLNEARQEGISKIGFVTKPESMTPHAPSSPKPPF